MIGSMAWRRLSNLHSCGAPARGGGARERRRLALELALPAAGLALALAGDVALEDFRANALSLSEEMLNWKSLDLRMLALAMVPGQPLRLSVGVTALSDYFARIIVLPNGTLNLQGLVKQDAGVASPPAAEASGTASIPPAQASAQPDIRFGPISLVNGRVFFSDRFIQPNHSANLSELTGGLGAFASAPAAAASGAAPLLADLTLKGRVEGTAQARQTQRGVAYKIDPSGQLSASNKIVLNQLNFGEQVAGSDAPNLPVKLAVALLADRQGVININLPVSGSINDPQFRIGPIV